MEWVDIGDGLRCRSYESYKQYLSQQGLKHKRRPEFAKNMSDALRFRLGQRLEVHSEYIPESGSVLCLGARAGGEVAAFRDHGYFAIGVDVNPGKSNRYVVYGDFHELEFGDASVDILYTNSLDHVLDIAKLMGEVTRVLKDGGLFMTENKGGTHEPGHRGAKSDGYDCMEWRSLAHLINFVSGYGFDVIHRYRGRGYTPWGILYTKTL